MPLPRYFCGAVISHRFLAASIPPTTARQPCQVGTQYRGQPGSRLGNAPVLGASRGFFPALCGGSPALRLRFVVVFVRLPCGFRTGFLLGSSWVSSPVPHLFAPLLGVHFRPFPTIRVLGYPLPPSELSALGVGAISSGITGRLSILALYPFIHSGTWVAIRAACSAFLSRP